jgi:hypothetical protein
MAGPLHYNDFIRKFRRYGVSVSRIGATHSKMEKYVEGKLRVFIAVVHGNAVDPVYVSKARRRFKLRPEDGVSDRDFQEA